MDNNQKCAKCKKEKSFDEYDKKGENDIYATCKECREKNNLQSKRSYHKNKGKVNCEYCKRSWKSVV